MTSSARYFKIAIAVITILMIATICNADWKYNPFTGKLDYYELVSVHTASTGTNVHGLGTMSTQTASDYSTTTTANGLYLSSSWTPTWGQISSTPTTLSGYGITDAAPSSHVTATAAHGSSGAILGRNEAPYVLCKTSLISTVTGTTAETTLYTCTIPANAMRTNGTIYTDVTWSYTNSGNNKVTRVKFGGSNYLGITRNTTANAWTHTCIQNVNSATVQIGCSPQSIHDYTTSTAAIWSSAVDTTADVPLLLTCALASAAETCGIVRAVITIVP